MDRLAERVADRWPWLADDEDSGGTYSVFAGTRQLFAVDRGGVVPIADGDPAAPYRTATDPAWIVEALCWADEAVPGGTDAGTRGRSWRFVLDPDRHAELWLATDALRRRPERLSGWAWIDEDGLLRRVTWTRLTRCRPRAPRRRHTPGRLWETLELTDHGLAPPIELPAVPARRRGETLLALGKLLRRRRAHRRGR